MKRKLINNSRALIEKLEKMGWVEVGCKGSHHKFAHPDIKGKITVPHPKKDIPLGTVKSIYKQAGWI